LASWRHARRMHRVLESYSIFLPMMADARPLSCASMVGPACRISKGSSMGTNVYANGMEIACKASSGKSTAQFPDVCFTPPQTPATPTGVPTPYPNTAKASNCKKGSKNVTIRGKEVMLKNKSYITDSTGDEAGSAPLKNLVTHTKGGKAYFAAWSMNVKVEGKNVPRHRDIMTHNHASGPTAGPNTYSSVKLDATGSSEDDRCELKPYSKKCKDGKTPHHCIPDHCFRQPPREGGQYYYSKGINHSNGLCICVEGTGKSTSKKGGAKGDVTLDDFNGNKPMHYAALAEHGRIHAKFDEREAKLGQRGKPKHTAKLGNLEKNAAKIIAEVTGCDEAKIKKQLRKYHKQKGFSPETRVRADPDKGTSSRFRKTARAW
jgi:hypothetical protein